MCYSQWLNWRGFRRVLSSLELMLYNLTLSSLNIDLRAGYLSVRTTGDEYDRRRLKVRLTYLSAYLLAYLLQLLTWVKKENRQKS